MAYIWLHPQCKNYYAKFKDRAGKWRNRSTGTTDADAALKIANTYEDAARRKKTALQVRRTIVDVSREILGTDAPSMTVREYRDAWLKRRAREVSDSSMATYRGVLNQFVEYLGDDAGSELMDISQQQVQDFREHLAVSGLSVASVNHKLKVMKMFFRSARADGLLLDDPAEHVRTLRKARGKVGRRAFSLEELRAVLSVANEEWQSMILCGLYTGQRLGDIASLTWANVDLAGKVLRLETRKTGKRLIIPLSPALEDFLLNRAGADDPNEPLHPEALKAFRATGKTATLSNQFGKILSQAGLRSEQAHRKTHGEGRGKGSSKETLSFHSLRHTAVTLLKEAGVPDAVVMQLVGHDSKAMSDHYTHVGQQALSDAAAKMPKL